MYECTVGPLVELMAKYLLLLPYQTRPRSPTAFLESMDPQMNQDRFNAAVCVGSCGLYRRVALEPFGGMAPIAHSEDMYTGFKMTENGFSVRL